MFRRPPRLTRTATLFPNTPLFLSRHLAQLAQAARAGGKTMSAPLLAIDGISKSFRGLRAVYRASLAVPQGAIVSLIGPNGAGKTTMFNMAAGVFRPDEGSISFAGRRIDGLRPDQICHAGIGRTFQLVTPFPDLTALENVLV